MRHRDLVILNKIIDELNIAINALCDKSFRDFDSDELFKRGICMTVINIGELVKNLSPEFRAAHKYGTLNMNDVYNTVINDFPVLKENILKFL